MSRDLARRAGSAVVWRSIALAGEKLVFLARLIILARILEPSDFGLVAIGMAAMVLLVTLTDFGVVSALVQSPSNEKSYLDTAWTLSVCRGVLVALVLLLAAPYIADAFGVPAATPFVRAISVTALLRALASIRLANLNRELHFRSLALIGLASALVNTIVAVMVAESAGAWALIFGSIAGAATFLLASFAAAPYRPRVKMNPAAARSILTFGQWIFLVGVIAVLGDTILRLIITRQLGVAELGLFFLAARLGFLPAQLISEILGTVAFPVYAHLQDDRRKARKTYRKVLLATATMMIPAGAIFVTLVPALVTDLLGERWQGSVVIMQLLVIGGVAGILTESIAPFLKGIGQPSRLVWMDATQFLALVAGAWWLVDDLGLAGAGLAWLAAVLVQQVLAYGYARKFLDQPFQGLARALMVICFASGIAAGIAMAIVENVAGITGILLAGAGAGTCAIILLVVLDSYYELGLREMLYEPFPWTRRPVRPGNS